MATQRGLFGFLIRACQVMVVLLEPYVPPIRSFLEPAAAKPPEWTEEIVTEVRGRAGSEPVTYRLGTLTCRGALPTGVSPALSAIWLAGGKVETGVHPPEVAFDPELFLKELEPYDVPTVVTVSRNL